MTEFIVTATAPRQQLVADGATSLVSFPFALEASDQLRVFLDDAELLTGFTVTVEPAGAGGTVRFTSPPIEGTRVTLLRESAIARTSDFLTGGAFRAAAINAELDRLTMAAQELSESRKAALRAPLQDAVQDMVLPAAYVRAGKVLAFDEHGRPAVALPRTAVEDTLQELVDAARDSKSAAASHAAIAAAAAGSLSLPVIGSGDAGKLLSVKADETGYELGHGLPTGFVTFGVFAAAPAGWLLLDGATLGDRGSGAEHAGLAFQRLFTLLWDSLADDAAPVSGGRGADAASDWTAGKTLKLPDGRGRAPIGAGKGADLTARSLGTRGGAEGHQLTLAELPAHSHDGVSGAADYNDNYITQQLASTNAVLGAQQASRSTAVDVYLPATAAGETHSHDFTTDSTGGDGAHSSMQPWLALNLLIKL